ncbi:MAG TPA: nucleoside 2-deoxyribosyltransferase [Caulobacteraceae bacterium]|nr:nucleoside 2-deoxyribosyltransferase [Caulobacteraceae bacterium]
MRVYVASPLGFSEAGRLFLDTVLHPLLRDAGFEVCDPWAGNDPEEIGAIAALPPGPQRLSRWRAFNSRVGAANADSIRACDLVLAVLDGPDVDSGVAAEIGFACALGKPVTGYRSDFRLAADNEGGVVNLQVEYFIRATGGAIAANAAELTGSLQALARAMDASKA